MLISGDPRPIILEIGNLGVFSGSTQVVKFPLLQDPPGFIAAVFQNIRSDFVFGLAFS